MLRKFATLSLIAAALTAGASAASANAKNLSKGVVLVPASYTEAPASASQGWTLYDFDATAQANDGFTRAEIVDYPAVSPKGAIIVDTWAHRLYLVLGNGKAAMYHVATAKPGFEWQGTHKVGAKAEWPDWRPPVEMRGRRPELPEFMAGGPKNPLGARAIYIADTIYRIHGTNEPDSIGKSASSGCIRMLNADVIELYSHVKIGASVTVI